ncbi:hypothetical protein DRQ25_11105 [Candidatus Fermentibacteria bacterium]|nr:MAG: hypothetical protein DRQ25_11105 [Candidatus Fermentibacteria bacterium]
MTVTDKAAVADQVQKYWAPLFSKELRASLMLGSLVSKEYQGQIKKGGDRVRVSQLAKVAGQTRTIGTDADVFTTDQLSTQYIDITADKRFVAAVELEDIVDLQSQIEGQGSEVREALMYGMQEQINDYLYGLVAASTATPDHNIASVADFNAAALSANRVLAGQAKWPKGKPWYCLADPVYYGDMADDTTLSSADFNAADPVIVSGEIATKRYGFNVLEDNALSADHALLFYEDFMHFVTQTEVQVKISDMHSDKRFGYVMSVDLIGGAKLGNDGDVKHIQVYNSAWAPIA